MNLKLYKICIQISLIIFILLLLYSRLYFSYIYRDDIFHLHCRFSFSKTLFIAVLQKKKLSFSIWPYDNVMYPETRVQRFSALILRKRVPLAGIIISRECGTFGKTYYYFNKVYTAFTDALSEHVFFLSFFFFSRLHAHVHNF